MTCAPRKTQFSAGISLISLRWPHEEALGPKLPISTQWRLWSDWADAQAGLSLRWVHRSTCWFCHTAANLQCLETGDTQVVAFLYYTRYQWGQHNQRFCTIPDTSECNTTSVSVLYQIPVSATQPAFLYYTRYQWGQHNQRFCTIPDTSEGNTTSVSVLYQIPVSATQPAFLYYTRYQWGQHNQRFCTIPDTSEGNTTSISVLYQIPVTATQPAWGQQNHVSMQILFY